MGCPRRSRAACLTASSLVLAAVLAGCGSGRPKLARADAARLTALTHRIARESACAQARDIPTLQRRAIALVNAGRVPAALQEPLLSGVSALAAETPVCLPKVTASAPAPTAPHPAPPPRPAGRGHGGHGHPRGPAHGEGRDG